MDKKKILIADDETGIRLTVGRILDKDYVVLEATNGEEAVEIAKGQKPDLILMDLIMPKMDGYAACSQIKADEATKGIPVVILTAVGNELNKKFATEMGAEGYITKPFNIQELIDVITPLLAKTL
ncbi:MAG: response regulator [Dehalococcoidia bacterium]|nr:MAG: response regulator [Dehalococcoidia bacterium]